MFDRLLRGGTLVRGEGVLQADVAIEGGRFAALLPPGAAAAAREVSDMTGKVLLPGVIDTHVHLRDPGHPSREDFTTGTQAAVAGGVTTILEMPISVPPVNSAAVLRQRAAAVQPKAVVDFALYAAVGRDNIDRVPELAAAGAVAFKTFMHAAPPGREEEFRGLICTDLGALYDIMLAVRQTGLRHCIHSEQDQMLERFIHQLQAAGRRDALAHAQSRPEVVEEAAVAEVLALARASGCPVEIVHMSAPRAMQMVAEAKAQGVDVLAETCPQYLFLSDEDLSRHGPYAKCNPPLRPRAAVEQNWQHLRQGHIDFIGTDHAPYVPAEKEVGWEDIFRAAAGFPGLETWVALLASAVHEGRLSWPEVARLTSENAARHFRLPGKGRIAPGYDADITVIDPAARWQVNPARFYSKARQVDRVYAGRALTGQVAETILRGTTVYHRESGVLAPPGNGKWLRPGSA